ncbi:MAG: protein-L-isoaspartate O-methyltransferase, partial [Gemmatimonadetes bacterium]|nr:protein-L-isoaspartate O-methyltransferase [Gemmatimonadota bacterium]
ALRPYDRISITAACRDVPPPLLEQLSPWSRLIGPVVSGYETQELILVEKTEETIRKALICEVLYVSLQGRYGS